MDLKSVAAQGKQLTKVQQEALARLRDAAKKFEGVFLGMLMSEMSKTVSKQSIFGKESASEQSFSQMLDQARATQVAQGGSLGMARLIEQQLRGVVLADAAEEAKGRSVEGDF